MGLNWPKAMNSIDALTLDGISRGLDVGRWTTQWRSVVIIGTGEGFCPGVDLNHALALQEGAPGSERAP
jgi:enoyl-CoA hydratase/carnithine racemase